MRRDADGASALRVCGEHHIKGDVAPLVAHPLPVLLRTVVLDDHQPWRPIPHLAHPIVEYRRGRYNEMTRARSAAAATAAAAAATAAAAAAATGWRARGILFDSTEQ
jgi:hypothetical protein